MSGAVSFNPYATTSLSSDVQFLTQTQGYVQGACPDDPASRDWLMNGVLASSETIPMWGGVPVTELINVMGTGSEGLGPQIKRATSQANTTGWSVYDQAGHMVVTPGSTAPLAGTTNSVHFFRNGTNRRVPVQLDPALVTSLSGAGDYISQPTLYWDVTNYRVTLTSAGNFALPTTAKLISMQTQSLIVLWNGTVATWASGSAGLLLI